MPSIEKDHKLLFCAMINTNYLLGGAETVMHQIASEIAAAGDRCHFIVPSLGKTLRRPRNVRLLFPRLLNRLRFTRWNGVVERLYPSVPTHDAALTKLGRGRYDVFHVHSFTGYASISTLANLAATRPVLWTLHSYWGDSRHMDGRGTPYEAAWGLAPQLLRSPRSMQDLEKLHAELKPLFDTPIWVSTPSRKVVAALQQCADLKAWTVSHIPNGVDASMFCPSEKRNPQLRKQWGLDPEKTVILLVNRDFKIVDKGFGINEEALQRFSSRRDLQVVLVGQNADWAAARLPLSLDPRSFNFIADRASLISLYNLADIFLFASSRENFPCVTLEAMAGGCCVVATPTDGVTEQIDDGWHGLIAREISGTALTEPLERAISDEALRLQLGENARKRVEAEFSEAMMIEKYIHIYRKMREAPSAT